MKPTLFAGGTRGILAALALLAILSACSRGDRPLPGERVPVNPVEAALTLEAAPARPIGLPAPRVNADWAYRNGAASGPGGHLALSEAPQLRWSRPIGAGQKARTRLVVTPIVAGGLIYTIDAEARLVATARDGAAVWSRSLARDGHRANGATGGGMAHQGGTLYVATGFGEILALDAASGGERWRAAFEAPVNGAPVVQGGRVIAVLRNDVGLALDAASGEELWRVESAGGIGLLGGAAPAVAGGLAVLPFASGEVIAVAPASGETRWITAISTGRATLARRRILDISGDPVISGDAVYLSSQSGRTVRVEASSGGRLWTMTEGAYGPVWPVGGALFLMSDVSRLVRADAARGEVVWAIQLPNLHPNRNWLGDRLPYRAVTHFGPVLAGGRLWVASGDGMLRAFRPTDGGLVHEIALPGPAATVPVVAGGVMYVVTTDGVLHALQ